MTNVFFDYAKRISEDYDSNAILGMLAWYTVPEFVEIEHSNYAQLIEKFEPPIKTPDVPKPAHVFRRACKSAKLTKIPTQNPDRFYNFVLRDAGYDPGFVFRRVVQETIDSKNHSLGFRDLGLVSFNKEGVTATYTPEFQPGDPSEDYWDNIRSRIDSFLATRMVNLPSIAIREGARKAIEDKMYGLKVREGGGVYFVSVSHIEKLQAVDSVINSVENCSLHILPLIDDVRQREMIKEAFEVETVDETETLIAEIATLLKSDENISAKSFENLQERYAEKKARLTQYTDILNEELDRSTTILEVCRKQLFSLLDSVS